MDGDAQKIDPENEDSLMNVNPSSEHGLSKSRNLFRQKDPQHTSVLSSGKWLQIVKNSPKVSCEVSTSPSNFLSKVEESYEAESSRIRSYQSEKVISLSSKTLLSPSTYISQGTLQFTMRDNGSPSFVFKLENQKDIYVASLSSNVKDQSVLDYSYMIYLQRGKSSSSSSHLVGRIKVSTLSSSSSLNERIKEREFVLFSSNGEHPCRKKNRGLSKKAVDVIKNNQSISRLRCSWDEQLQEPSFENNLATNLETLAVVVKQEFLEEDIGGWGLKFLKKSRFVQTNDDTETENETSRSLISMDAVIPSGIHGGPEDRPLSLIQRWKSEGNCDCGGWDLGCSLTILKGQPRKDHCNLFDLSVEVTFKI